MIVPFRRYGFGRAEDTLSFAEAVPNPRVATLFGLAEQMHSRIHYTIDKPMRAMAKTVLATVQATPEPTAFVDAFATRQRMSLDEAFATILAPTQDVMCPG